MFKPGKVVVLLRGRFAGHKAVIVRVHEEAVEDRKFAHAVVAGVERYPRKITRAMQKADAKAEGKKKGKVTHRSSVRPFVKNVNLNHLMPTRYTVDLNEKLKTILDDATLVSEEKLGKAKKEVRKLMDDKYRTVGSANEKQGLGLRFLFTKLRF